MFIDNKVTAKMINLKEKTFVDLFSALLII